MSEENVEALKRGFEAFNRRDVEALLEVLDPGVEWFPALLASIAGGAAVYRGHEGVREMVRDVGETFEETHAGLREIRDLGNRLVAIGHVRARGKASGAWTESPLCYVVDYRGGKVIRVQTYLDRDEALEAAGLRE
jgi:uncharacterized protein